MYPVQIFVKKINKRKIFQVFMKNIDKMFDWNKGLSYMIPNKFLVHAYI